MVSSDDDDRARERFEELAGDLNMDTDTSDEAWSSYKRISTNYTLEVVRFTRIHGVVLRVIVHLMFFSDSNSTQQRIHPSHDNQALTLWEKIHGFQTSRCLGNVDSMPEEKVDGV